LYSRVILAVTGFLPLTLSAYNLTPSLLRLSPIGDESSAFLYLENKGMQATAIQITIQEHHKDLDGKAVGSKEAEGDFLIYPAQLVMVPGDEVGVQVRWIGEPTLSSERAYTLVAREVSIPRQTAKGPEPDAGIRIDVTVLMNYEVRVYMTPKGAKPMVVVESVTESTQLASPGTLESDWLEIIFANQGTAHEAMSNMALVLTPLAPTGDPLNSPTVTLPARDIPALTRHLLAGERRRILIPRPAGLPTGPVRVTLSE